MRPKERRDSGQNDLFRAGDRHRSPAGEARPGDCLALPRCFVPGFDGAFLSSDSKDALWARFYMGAPQRRRRSVERYNIVMSGRIWTPPDCKRVWQTLVQGSQLLTYIRLPYAA